MVRLQLRSLGMRRQSIILRAVLGIDTSRDAAVGTSRCRGRQPASARHPGALGWGVEYRAWDRATQAGLESAGEPRSKTLACRVMRVHGRGVDGGPLVAMDPPDCPCR